METPPLRMGTRPLRMETPLRGRSGGHTGAAPTISRVAPCPKVADEMLRRWTKSRKGCRKRLCRWTKPRKGWRKRLCRWTKTRNDCRRGARRWTKSKKVAGEVLADGLNREKVAGEVLAADYPCGLSQERGSSDEMTARYGGR